MSNDRQIDIQLKAKDLTSDAFGKVKNAMRELKDETERTTATGGKSWGGLFATIAGGVAVGDLISTSFQAAASTLAALPAQLVALGQRGADVADVRGAFDGLTASVGQTSGAMLGELRRAFGGTLTDFDLMKSANEALGKGVTLTADDMGVLGRASRAMADRVGGDAKQAFDSLLDSIANGQEKTLKQLPLNLQNIEQAVKGYADAMGLEVSQLSQSQQQTALRNAVLAESKRILQDTGEVQNDFSDNLAAGKTLIANWTDNLAEAIATAPGLGTALNELTGGLIDTFGGDRQQQVRALSRLIDQGTISVLQFAENALSAGDVVGRAWSAVRMTFDSVFSLIYWGGLRMVNITTAIAEVGALLPGVGGSFDDVRRKSAETAAKMAETQRSFHEGAEAALEGMKGNHGLAQSAAALGARLADVRGKVEAAANAQTTATEGTDRLHRGQDGLTTSTGELTKAQKEAARLTEAHAHAVQALVDKIGGGGATRDAGLLAEALMKLGGAHRLTRDGAAEVNKILTESMAAYRDLGQHVPEWMTNVWYATLPKPEVINGLADLNQELTRTRELMLDTAPKVPIGSGLNGLVLPGKVDLPKMGGLFAGLSEAIRTQLGPVLVGAFQGGGDAGKAAGGFFGGALGQSILGAPGKGGLGDFLTKHLGSTLGGALGSAVPVVGTMLGSLGGKLMDALGDKLFKGEGRRVNDLRDQFLSQFGGSGTGAGSGFGSLAGKLHEVGAAGDAMFQRLVHASKESDFKRAVDDVTDALGRQKQAMETTVPSFASASAAAEALGLDINKIGDGINQLRVHDSAEAIAAQWEVLKTAGADMNQVAEGAAGKFQTLVDEALKWGHELPASMREPLELMAKQGRLTDAAGDKLEDLSGIKWAEPLEKSVDRLVDKMDVLIDRIGNGLVGAFDSLPDRVSMSIDATEGRGGIDADGLPKHEAGTRVVRFVRDVVLGVITPDSAQPRLVFA